MGRVNWIGGAPAVADVATVTLTAYDATTTYKITRNGKTVSTVGTGGTTATTATALQALLAASAIPEFLEVTWTVNSSTITATSKTAGLPTAALFSSSVSGGAGTIGTFSVTTTYSGPNDWATAVNWDTGVLPAGGDDVWVENTSQSILYGIDQHTLTLNSLTIPYTFSGTIGLPRINVSGAYVEDRSTYLKISATTVNIGAGSGAGSGRIKLNTGTNAATVTVYGMGTTVEPGIESFLYLGAHASNVFNLASGSVAIASFSGETATVPVITVNGGNGTLLRCGAGATLTTVTVNGGKVTVNSNVTTVTVNGGVYTQAAGVWTTMNCWSGTAVTRTASTHATTIIGPTGQVDCSQAMGTVTFTNGTIYKGGQLLDPYNQVVMSNPFSLPDGGPQDIIVKRKAGGTVKVA